MTVWLAAVAGAVAVVVVAEFAARAGLRLRGRYLVNVPHQKRWLQLDPGLSPHMEPSIRYETNSAGERGDEGPADPERTVRIAVVGGSATQCFFVDQPATWPERIAAVLRERGVPDAMGASGLHVGNLGQSELTSHGARLIVRHTLSRYPRLDAVILMFGISDMLRWLRLGTPPTVPESTYTDVFYVHPEGPFSWSPRALAVTELGRRIRTRWEQWRTPIVRRSNVGASVVQSRARRQRATTIIDEAPDPTPMLREYRRNLAAVIRDLTSRGAAVIVTGQPHFDSAQASDDDRKQFWNGAVGDPAAGPVTTYYSERVLDTLAWTVNGTARDVAQDLGVPYVDLDAVVPCGPEYYYDQFHLTPAGADLVGRAVADVLVRTWLPGPAAAEPQPTSRPS